MDLILQNAIPALAISLILLGTANAEVSRTANPDFYGEKAYVYILVVPDADLKRLEAQAQKLRQDEDEGGGNGLTFLQSAGAVSQIIAGLLGGDFRPVFAGGVQFVEDPAAQMRLGGFLTTIAPGINLVLREMYVRAQSALGFAPSTPKPVPAASLSQSSQSLNPTRGKNNSTASLEAPSVQQSLRNPVPTTSWEFVLNQVLRESTTSAPPLPFIRLRTTTIDPDDYDNSVTKAQVLRQTTTVVPTVPSLPFIRLRTTEADTDDYDNAVTEAQVLRQTTTIVPTVPTLPFIRLQTTEADDDYDNVNVK